MDNPLEKPVDSFEHSLTYLSIYFVVGGNAKRLNTTDLDFVPLPRLTKEFAPAALMHKNTPPVGRRKGSLATGLDCQIQGADGKPERTSGGERKSVEDLKYRTRWK